jgi:osmotically-inducible protein OsmY
MSEDPRVANGNGKRKMARTLALIAAVALSVYGSSAFSQAATPQAATPPASQGAGQPAQDAGGPNDESIRQAVISALNADPNHFFRHVDVRVDNGVATLSGFVHSSSSIFRARTIASGVPGVTRVLTSNLTLEPNRPR